MWNLVLTSWDGKTVSQSDQWIREDTDNGVSRAQLTQRKNLKIMNSLAGDFKMTPELPTDFPDRYLPTLDCKLKLVNVADGYDPGQCPGGEQQGLKT